MIANLMIAFLDSRPGNAKRYFLLTRVAAMLVMGAIKGRPENILCMRGQMVAHKRR